MPNFFQRLQLVQRAREACDAHRALRRAQHRASLKAKRAAVRARLNLEIHRVQLERAMLRMEAAQTAARVQGAMRVAAAQKRRDEAVRKKLSEHGGVGVALPGAGGGLGDMGRGNVEEREFKEGVVRRVEETFEGKGGVMGGRVASAVLREAVEGMSLEGETDDTGRSLKILAGMAKKAGVGWAEMEKLVDMVEPDEERRAELREALRAVMEKEGGEKSADACNN